MAAGIVALFGGPIRAFLYVSQTIKNDLGPLAIVCAMVFGPAIGASLIRLRKRRKARGALDVLERDARPPVLYLRSFGADERAAEDAGTAVSIRGIQISVTTTEEEQIAKVVERAGPMLAIGRPNETMPLLGAARMYVADEQWQNRVLEMVESACLVLMRVGKTEGFWWAQSTSSYAL